MLAAKRAGIKEIILCEQNRRDVEEIKKDYLKDLKFHYVKNMLDVVDLALLDEKVEDAIDFTRFIPKKKRAEMSETEDWFVIRQSYICSP